MITTPVFLTFTSIIVNVSGLRFHAVSFSQQSYLRSRSNIQNARIFLQA